MVVSLCLSSNSSHYLLMAVNDDISVGARRQVIDDSGFDVDALGNVHILSRSRKKCDALVGTTHGDSYTISWRCAGAFVGPGSGSDPDGVSNGFMKSR